MESIPEEMTDESRWGDGSDIKEYSLGMSDTNNGHPCHSVPGNMFHVWPVYGNVTSSRGRLRRHSKVVKSLITSGERRREFRGETILEVFLRQILEDLQNVSNTCYSCCVTQNCLTHYSCSETQKCRVISLLLFVHRRSLNTDNIRHTPTPSFIWDERLVEIHSSECCVRQI